MSTTGSRKNVDLTYKYSRYFTYKIHSTPNADWINAIFRIMILRYAPYDNHHYFELLCIEIETWIFISFKSIAINIVIDFRDNSWVIHFQDIIYQ